MCVCVLKLARVCTILVGPMEMTYYHHYYGGCVIPWGCALQTYMRICILNFFAGINSLGRDAAFRQMKRLVARKFFMKIVQRKYSHETTPPKV